MKFIEFTEKFTGAKHYFVGKTNQSILADTTDGSEFGGIQFGSHRSITREDAERLNLGYFSAGIEAVEGGCLSYKLQTLRKELEDGDRISFCSCQAGGYMLRVQDGKLLFAEQDSRGDWDNWSALTHKNKGLFSTALSQLEWEEKDELRMLEESTRRSTLVTARLQKISTFLAELRKLP